MSDELKRRFIEEAPQRRSERIERWSDDEQVKAILREAVALAPTPVDLAPTSLADALAAALRRIHDKRCEMDMGDLSADEAITEADDIARAALAAWEGRK